MKKVVKNGYRVSLNNANNGMHFRLNYIRIEEYIYSSFLKRKHYSSYDKEQNKFINKICYEFLSRSHCDFKDKKRQKEIEDDFKFQAKKILKILN